MWLHVPSSALASAPESAALNLASSSPSPDTVPYVSLSGKPTRHPLSWRGWKRRPWMTRLFGAIFQPSTVAHGMESWISSLRASHASPSPSPASNSGPMMNAGFGQMWNESLGRFNPDGSFSKTCLDLFGTDSDPSSVDWPASGMMRNGICSVRQGSGRPIGESDSSCSQGDAWQTPGASSFSKRRQVGQTTREELLLPEQARQWPTPRTISGGAESAERKQELGRTESGGGDLRALAQAWPTPNAHDSASPEGLGNEGRARDNLGYHSRYSPQALRISTCGPECSQKHRRLNPLFVEWLMGWPRDWSSVVTASGPAATELSPWKQRMRSSLSRIAPDGWRSYYMGNSDDSPTA